MTDEQKVENRILDEPEKEELSGESKTINKINVSNNNNKDNEIETGKLNNFDDGYEEGEESEHISEDPIDQQVTN